MWVLVISFTYQINSQSMGQPGKQKAARDSRFVWLKKSEFREINLLWGQ